MKSSKLARLAQGFSWSYQLLRDQGRRDMVWGRSESTHSCPSLPCLRSNWASNRGEEPQGWPVPDQPGPDETVVSAEEASQMKGHCPLLPTNIFAADQRGSDWEKATVFCFPPSFPPFPPLSSYSLAFLDIYWVNLCARHGARGWVDRLTDTMQ